jgi:hypothetical protein
MIKTMLLAADGGKSMVRVAAAHDSEPFQHTQRRWSHARQLLAVVLEVGKRRADAASSLNLLMMLLLAGWSDAACWRLGQDRA